MFTTLLLVGAVALVTLLLVGFAMSVTYRPAPEEVFHYVRHYAREPLSVPLRGKPWPIHYLEFGNPHHPMIILWHGVGSRAGQFLEFTHIAEALEEQGFYVIVPDLPGHGRTPAPREPEDFRIEALSALIQEFTAAILRMSKSPSCVWAAHSLSAAGALGWAASCAQVGVNPLPKLKGIATIGLPAARSVPWLLAGVRLPWASKLLPLVLYRFGRFYFSLYLGVITRDPSLRRLLLELYYPRSREAVFAQVCYIRENLGLLTAPQSVFERFRAHAAPVPLVFLHGSHDRLFPMGWVKDLVGTYLPNAPFLVWPGAGHDAIDDLPEEVTRAVTFFARGQFQRFDPRLARKASACGLAAGHKERHRASSPPLLTTARVPHRPHRPSWGRRVVAFLRTVSYGLSDVAEYMLVIYVPTALLVGAVALFTAAVTVSNPFTALQARGIGELVGLGLGGVPLLLNALYLTRFVRGRYALRQEITRLSRTRGGREQVKGITLPVELGARSGHICAYFAFSGIPIVIFALIGVVMAAVAGMLITESVVPKLGQAFIVFLTLGTLALMMWVWFSWSMYAEEPERDCKALVEKRRQLRAAKSPSVTPSAPLPPAALPSAAARSPASSPRPASPPSPPSTAAPPHTGSTAPKGPATPPDDRVVRILARSIYREVRQLGYTKQQIVALATGLIELVQQDLAANQPRAH